MKPDPLTPRDEDLLRATRHAASRHLDVPPTPRDTLAVLRQAAEAGTAPQTGWSLWLRCSVAAIALAIIALGIDLVRSPMPNPSAVVESTPATIDPGIDLVEWNVELDTLFDDVTSTLDQLASDESDLNALAEDLLN
jgi:hypothetical protein